MAHFTQAGMSDGISALFAEYGRHGALAQCSKVKKNLGEVIRLKEGVICEKGRVKWTGRQCSEWPREPLHPLFPLLIFVQLHLVRTSSQQEHVLPSVAICT